MTADASSPPDASGGEEVRLDSWKAIASHLNRHVTTVRRWEKHEGLPVHRHLHHKLGSVYAYASELDAWWRNRRPDLDRPAMAACTDAPAPASRADGPSTSRSRAAGDARANALLSGVAAACVIVTIGYAMGAWARPDEPSADAHVANMPARAAGDPIERRVHPAARQEFLAGRYHLWRDTEENLQRAIAHFERAARFDPQYADAYASLGHAWWKRGMWGRGGIRLADAEAPARAAAQRALELNDRSAAPYVLLAELERLNGRDLVRAEGLIVRALSLDVHDVEAHYSYGLLLMELGRFPEAIEHMRVAEALDPLAPAIQSDFGRVLYRAHRYDDAIARYTRALELEPEMAWLVQQRLAETYERTGRYGEALAALHSAGANSALDVARVARVLALMGNRVQAHRMLESRPANGTPLPSTTLAAAYAALGERATAFALLFGMLENRAPGPNFVPVDPRFDSLRSDARWPELVHRIRVANGTHRDGLWEIIPRPPAG